MNENIKVFDEKMKKTIEVLGSDFNGIRAGRANPHILDKVTVDYYGTQTPLNQVGNITVPEPRMIVISPWEKTIIPEIQKSLQASDVGITPIIDGDIIRLNFPDLTKERREELSKDIKKRGEDAKVAIRNIRRDGNDAIKKLKGSDFSEDMIKDMEDELQKLTDNYIKEIDEKVNVKTKEIMTV